jgi:hypothetical protein
MEEIWKKVENYEGYYEVSNFGRIRSVNRKIKASRGSTRIREGKIMIPQLKKNYYEINLSKLSDTKNYILHRLIAKAFIPNPLNKKEVNHINGIGTDNRIENLEWVTARENSLHAYRTGLKKTRKGEGKENSKLTEENIMEIRSTLPYHGYKADLARKFSVTITLISRVTLGKCWKHV